MQREKEQDGKRKKKEETHHLQVILQHFSLKDKLWCDLCLGKSCASLSFQATFTVIKKEKMSKCAQVKEVTLSRRLASMHTQGCTHLHTHTHTESFLMKSSMTLCALGPTCTRVGTHTHTHTQGRHSDYHKVTHTLLSPGHYIELHAPCCRDALSQPSLEVSILGSY